MVAEAATKIMLTEAVAGPPETTLGGGARIGRQDNEGNGASGQQAGQYATH
jgi:hypothetical protein